MAAFLVDKGVLARRTTRSEVREALAPLLLEGKVATCGVVDLLASRSQRRGVSLPDLLIAACAECGELTVLHYYADYDRIAELTGQPTQWVVPRGSVS